MKSKIDVPALVCLLIAAALTGFAIRWAWLRHLADPGEISCGGAGFTVPSCGTSFGDTVLIIALVAAPVLGLLAHQAFFSK